MRGLVLVALLGACGFEHGSLPSDGDIDAVDSIDAFEPTWTVDGTSKKGVPSTAGQWTDVNSAAGLSLGAPTSIWLMQEASGSLSDSVGSATLNPFGSPAPSYSAAVPGWSRHAVATPQMQGDIGFGSSSTGNLDGTSYLVLVYAVVTSAPPTNRTVFGIGNQYDHHYVMVTPAGVFAATYGPPAASLPVATGTMAAGTTVHPIVLKIDAASQHFVVYTDQERLEPTWAATSGFGNLVIVGNAITNAGAIDYLYGALWSGPAAVQTDANIKKLLQTLGWTVTGY